VSVQVFTAVHCVPKVIKLTLGSWLETYDGTYDVEVHVGLHDNYTDYHKDGLEEIMAMEGVEFHFVKELDWHAEGLTRYSKMHALSILNMMEAVKDRSFSHAFLFDHDLLFHQDFIKWVLTNHLEADIVGCLFDDLDAPRKVDGTDDGLFLTFFQKISVWHMAMSRRCFDNVIANPDAILPERFGDEVYDTFARGLEWARGKWGFDVRLLPSAELEKVVGHFGSASMNFGRRFADNYPDKISMICAMCDERFPNGIDHLLDKLKGKSR